MSIGIGNHFDQKRLIALDSALKCPCKGGGIIDPDRRAATSLRQADVINRGKVASGCVVPEFDGFRVALEAEDAVVEYDDHQRQSHPNHCLQFGPAMCKAAI